MHKTDTLDGHRSNKQRNNDDEDNNKNTSPKVSACMYTIDPIGFLCMDSVDGSGK